jgi:hypothetical protein
MTHGWYGRFSFPKAHDNTNLRGTSTPNPACQANGFQNLLHSCMKKLVATEKDFAAKVNVRFLINFPIQGGTRLVSRIPDDHKILVSLLL